ncbi:hypothetical protein MBLNU230_g7855t1 [Neophaeotheca triangularis]
MALRAAFDVRPFQNTYRAASTTTIKRPREIAFFSYDDAHVLHVSSEQSLRYYYPAVIHAPGRADGRHSHISLGDGFGQFLKRDDKSDEHLDALLATIIDHEKKQGQKLEVDFITWRGMMTKFLTAPFDKFSDFEMNATCFQGTIYIEENNAYKQEKNRLESARPPPRHGIAQEEMQFWGYKFETLSSLPRPWAHRSRDEIENRHQEQVSNYAQFCSVVRTGIGSSSLAIGGEIDAIEGVRPDDDGQHSSWVEFKTSKVVATPKDEINYERKLLSYWAQSFLLGVPKIVVGFRDDNGNLMASEELETQKLPGLVKNRMSHSWDGNICLEFSAELLAFLKTTIVGEGVWRIKRNKGTGNVEVSQVEASGTGDILSEDFKAHRQEMIAGAGVTEG